MTRSTKQRRLASLCVLVFGLGAACQSAEPGADRVDQSRSVCPSCEPSAGGETGDFGGSTGFCSAISRAVEVDAEQAAALGFDVAELERRALRPIELSLRWRVSRYITLSDDAGKPASGYQEHTRISATVSSTGVLRHVRPDPELCDGAICALNGQEIEEAACPDWLELGVTADVETHDGALHARTEGVAEQRRPAPNDAAFDRSTEFVFITHADLSDVTGGLVLEPRAGGLRYQGTLHFSAWLSADGWHGEIAPSVMIYHSENTATQYSPLFGSFPPGDEPDGGMAQGGTSR